MRVRIAVFAALALVGAMPIATQAQVTKKSGKHALESKAAMSRGTGPDQNVKSDSALNRANAVVPAPPAKGGAKTRGTSPEQLHVDNRTSWYVRIYVDGDYVGTVEPWGDSYGWGSCADHVYYARAVFDDGSVRVWGPVKDNLCTGTTWTLR